MKKYLLVTLLLIALIGVIYLMIDSQPKHSITNSTILPQDENISQVENIKETEYSIIRKGKDFFNINCRACHNSNMKDTLVGPALDRSIERWNYDTLGMLTYLKNPQQYFRNHPSKRMVELHRHFKNVPKPILENLTIEQMKAIFAYIEVDYYKVVNQ